MNRALFGATVRHRHKSSAYHPVSELETLTPSTMFTRILNYFKLILFVARVATTGFYAWARPVFVKAVTEVLVRAHEFVGALTSRCVPLFYLL